MLLSVQCFVYQSLPFWCVFICSDHPDKDTTTVLASFRNGYLDVILKISKVYPIPKCTMMFNVCISYL